MSTQKIEPGSGVTPSRIPSLPAWQRALRRAERMIAQGEFALAVLSLERARKSGADPYQCMLRIADLYRQMQRWHDALAAAEQATLLAPSRLPGWEMVLKLAQETGDQRRALTASRTLIKLSPRHIPAYTTLSEVYLKKGDITNALRVANTLIRLEPESATHHFNKALLCQHQNEIELAVYEFMQTIFLEPEGPYSESARNFLEDLDMMQLNQIITLAMEDLVFRTKLTRNCSAAAMEKGFALSPLGEHMLEQYCEESLPDSPAPNRVSLYH